MKKPIKLHGVLAVKKDLQTQANTALADLTNTFTKKEQRFVGFLQTFTPFESDTPEKPIETKIDKELTVQSTVSAELAWIKPFLIKALDAHFHVATGNMTAKADIILDESENSTDTVLVKDVPASTLLELEEYLQQTLKKLLLAIPTLDPVLGFVLDPAASLKGVYKSRSVEKTRTKMKKRILQLTKATDKHPETVQVYDEQVGEGTIREQHWSAALTPADKSAVLERLESLLRAVKKARARANETEVDVTQKIGNSLLTYVFGA